MKIMHVYFLVKDLAKSIEFYTGLLGIKPANIERNRWADWGDVACLALLASSAILPEKAVYGNNAVLNIRAENLEESLEKAKSIGAKIISEINVVHDSPYFYECFMIEDPDGNLIEIANWNQ